MLVVHSLSVEERVVVTGARASARSVWFKELIRNLFVALLGSFAHLYPALPLIFKVQSVQFVLVCLFAITDHVFLTFAIVTSF